MLKIRTLWLERIKPAKSQQNFDKLQLEISKIWNLIFSGQIIFEILRKQYCIKNKIAAPDTSSKLNEMVSVEDDSRMITYKARLGTFDSWPFQEDCNCTPDKVSLMNFWPNVHKWRHANWALLLLFLSSGMHLYPVSKYACIFA